MVGRMIFNLLLSLFLPVIAGAASGGLTIGSPCYTACFLKSMGVGGGCSAPSAPSNIGIDYINDAPNYNVTWDGSLSAVDGYEVAASTDGGAFVTTGGIDPGMAFYTHSGQIGDGHVYIYKVRATNAGVGCASSFTASVTNDIFYDVAYYNRLLDLDGDSKEAAVDNVGFGSLVEQGGPVARVTGINNFACSFSSATGHYLKSANSVGTGLFETDFTIALWIYCTSLPATTSDIITRASALDMRLQLDSGGTLSWTLDPLFSTPSTMALGSLNAWHLVVVTMTGGGGQPNISVDGASFNSSGDFANASSDDFLSICPPGATATLNGRIDELSIWPRALTIKEVQSLYGDGQGPPSGTARFK